MSEEKRWPYRSAGIPDELFIRGDTPMTKSEVRAIAMSKLCIEKESICWDIGAGTGSVSVEMALSATDGKVYAIEREEDAVELIKANMDAFACSNINVIIGKAPDALVGLPAPDRVFIGGSGGNLETVIQHVSACLRPGGILVADFIVVEHVPVMISLLEKNRFHDVDMVLASISGIRSVGAKHMLKPETPVFTIWGKK